MKKILLLLILAYSYSFSFDCQVRKLQTIIYSSSSSCLSFRNSDWGKTFAELQRNIPCRYVKTNLVTIYADTENECPANDVIDPNTVQGDRVCFFRDGEIFCNVNPDPLGGKECRDLFQKDGTAYTCNPNTNEATPIENSDGVINDPEMGDVPNCSDGYSPVATQNIPNTGTTEGMFNSWSCDSNAGTGNGGTGGDEGTAPAIPDVPNSGVTTSANGTKSWSVGGTTYELTTDGTLTTTYADGTTSVKNLGSDYYNSGSSGGSSSGGTGGSGSNGNTTNETDNSNNNDTPIDNTPVADNCNDSNLTLQEKMLCELNAGMKKQNSESNPENSLNNLLKDMNNDNNTNATAINTNLKNTNTSLTGIKSLNENQLAEQKKTNDKLRSVENGVDGTNLLLGAANTKLEQIRDNLQEAPADSESFVDSITNSTNAMNDAYNGFNTFLNDMKSSYNNLLSQFDDAKSTFQIGLTFNPIQNIVNSSNLEQCLTVSVFKGNEVFLDFITPLLSIKPITTLIIQIFMLVEVVRMCFRIFDYARGIL